MNPANPSAKKHPGRKQQIVKVRRGRPPGITEEQMVNLETLLSNHNSIKSACILTGISEDNFHEMVAKSKTADPHPIYVEFAERMRKARVLGKSNLIRRIDKAGDEDWRALAWLGERIYPEDLAPPEKIQVDHRGKIQHDLQHKVIHVHLPAEIATPRISPPPKKINARTEPTAQ